VGHDSQVDKTRQVKETLFEKIIATRRGIIAKGRILQI
jgi:hypothetical protein